MLSRLNYYSRYHRIRQPHSIDSLYSLLVNFNIVNFNYVIPEKKTLMPIYDPNESEEQSENSEQGSDMSKEQVKEEQVEEQNSEKMSSSNNNKEDEVEKKSSSHVQSDIENKDSEKEQEQGENNEGEPVKIVQIVQTQSRHQQSNFGKSEENEENSEKVEGKPSQKEESGKQIDSNSFTDSLHFNQIPELHNSQIEETHKITEGSVEHAKSEIIKREPEIYNSDEDFQKEIEKQNQTEENKQSNEEDDANLENEENIEEKKQTVEENKKDEVEEEKSKNVEEVQEKNEQVQKQQFTLVSNLHQIQESKSEEEKEEQFVQPKAEVGQSTQSLQKSTQRKPFKKFMQNKKLNPRLVTSTILNEKNQPKPDEEQAPPKKVNFKKMMKKGQSSENFEKQEQKGELKKVRSERPTTESKKKLLSAFFDQN